MHRNHGDTPLMLSLTRIEATLDRLLGEETPHPQKRRKISSDQTFLPSQPQAAQETPGTRPFASVFSFTGTGGPDFRTSPSYANSQDDESQQQAASYLMENEGQYSIIGEASPGTEIPKMMQQYSAASTFSPNALAFDPLFLREGTFNMPQQHYPAFDAFTPAQAAFNPLICLARAAPTQHSSTVLLPRQLLLPLPLSIIIRVQ